MTAQQRALARHRRRLRRRDIARLEVRVRKEDVPIVREIVAALADEEHGAEARALLRTHFGARRTRGLEALLASAPLEGIELERVTDFGRKVDL